MSCHHANAISIMIRRDGVIMVELILFIQESPLKTSERAPIDAKMGHGLISTRWNGLNFVVII
jgi:hypothetical protein